MTFTEAEKSLKRGTQVAAIPDHAKSVEHPDVEFGFVTSLSVSGFGVFVRYWSKNNPKELRTKANSEMTLFRYLILYDYKPQEEIDKTLETL